MLRGRGGEPEASEEAMETQKERKEERKKEGRRKESTGGGGIITRQTDRKRDTQEEDAVVRTRLHAPLAYSLSILYHHQYVLAKLNLRPLARKLTYAPPALHYVQIVSA